MQLIKRIQGHQTSKDERALAWEHHASLKPAPRCTGVHEAGAAPRIGPCMMLGDMHTMARYESLQ